jgi:hypothetical protein
MIGDTIGEVLAFGIGVPLSPLAIMARHARARP